MNCCDDFGNCRQGRDCPARRSPADPRYCADPVAPIGRNYPYLPVTSRPVNGWRRPLRRAAKLALIVVVCFFASSLIAGVFA